MACKARTYMSALDEIIREHYADDAAGSGDKTEEGSGETPKTPSTGPDAGDGGV